MGQQQLLILILVTVIVGIAAIVAIDTLEETRINANYDAIRQEILQAHNQAVVWAGRPQSFGGGGGGYTGMTLADILLAEETEHAAYELEEAEGQSYTINAQSSYGFTVTATAESREVEFERSDED